MHRDKSQGRFLVSDLGSLFGDWHVQSGVAGRVLKFEIFIDLIAKIIQFAALSSESLLKIIFLIIFHYSKG